MSVSAPDDHLTADPNCRVLQLSSARRISGAGGCPGVRARIVSPASVKIRGGARSQSAPDDHFTAGPHCRVEEARASGALVALVAVQVFVLGLYLPTSVKNAAVAKAAPDDHLTAGPNCRVLGLGHRAH